VSKPVAALAAVTAPAAAKAAPAPAVEAAAKAAGTTVSELRGTTVPFTSLQAAVSRNMIESLKVSCLLTMLAIHRLLISFLSHISYLFLPVWHSTTMAEASKKRSSRLLLKSMMRGTMARDCEL
jgi:hypothetical protein